MLLTEPGDAFLQYALALELEKEGDILSAIVSIKDLLRKNEDYLGAYYKLGGLLDQMGQKVKAKEVFLKGMIVAQSQNNTKTYRELNEALQNLEEE